MDKQRAEKRHQEKKEHNTESNCRLAIEGKDSP